MTTTPLLAYYDDPRLRERFLDELRWHRDADAITRGAYSIPARGVTPWRGCAIGCALRSLNRMSAERRPLNDHWRFERELGIPTQLAFLVDLIFERLLTGHEAWPLEFASAIRAGADLSLAWPRLARWLVEDAAELGEPTPASDQLLAALDAHLGGGWFNSACDGSDDLRGLGEEIRWSMFYPFRARDAASWHANSSRIHYRRQADALLAILVDS